jgi:hypothetical protein
MNTEKNKLIAEFMGLTIITDGISFFDTNFKPLKKYNEDYNSLMQVVEKIENTQPISIIISCGNCEVYNCETAETLFFFEGVKIEAVYNACVAFIEWYNENK